MSTVPVTFDGIEIDMPELGDADCIVVTRLHNSLERGLRSSQNDAASDQNAFSLTPSDQRGHSDAFRGSSVLGET